MPAHRPTREASATPADGGYPMSELRARAFKREDFERADLVLVMDEGHLLRASRMCPPHDADKLCLLTRYCRTLEAREVPDPYYGRARDFELVLDLVEDACCGLLRHLGHLR